MFTLDIQSFECIFTYIYMTLVSRFLTLVFFFRIIHATITIIIMPIQYCSFLYYISFLYYWINALQFNLIPLNISNKWTTVTNARDIIYTATSSMHAPLFRNLFLSLSSWHICYAVSIKTNYILMCLENIFNLQETFVVLCDLEGNYLIRIFIYWF